MKALISSSSLVIALLWAAALPTTAQVNVTQEHNNLSRDGLYIDSAFTAANAANLTRDLNFNGTISGNVYAQPLYIEGGPNGAMVIAVTESNNVYALDADDGSVIWQRNLGSAVTSGLPCGNITPLGITGTPVVDLASRSLFLDAMIDGATKRHLVYSLNVDTGATNSNWPVDLNATARYNGTTFTSLVQNERGGLAIVNGILYVSFSGHAGDCGMYHGWVIGIPINNPSNVMAWATNAIGGGIWGHGGVASDGTDLFVVTGNTFTSPGDPWSGGEAIIRFQAGLIFSSFWAPPNWQSLDNSDADLGGSAPPLLTRRELRLRNWCSRWAKMASPTYLTATVWGALARRWLQKAFLLLSGVNQPPLTTRAREHILFFIAKTTLLQLIKLLPRIRLP